MEEYVKDNYYRLSYSGRSNLLYTGWLHSYHLLQSVFFRIHCGGGTTVNTVAVKSGYLNSGVSSYTVPYAVGDTAYFDGIECLVVAVDVEIQGSTHNAIAVDKNYNLDNYVDLTGTYIDGYEITQTEEFRWGAYGVDVGTSTGEVGYGLQDTKLCLNNSECFSCTVIYETQRSYPILWSAVKVFREQYGDDWFVPSRYEIVNYMYPYASVLGLSLNIWSSTEYSSSLAYHVFMYSGNSTTRVKYNNAICRICRAFTNPA